MNGNGHRHNSGTVTKGCSEGFAAQRFDFLFPLLGVERRQGNFFRRSSSVDTQRRSGFASCQVACGISLKERNRNLQAEIGIIGGSVAGLFTAHLLGQAGKQVRVFEGAEDFDPKPRTLIVTHRLHELLGKVGKSSLVNEIRRFELAHRRPGSQNCSPSSRPRNRARKIDSRPRRSRDGSGADIVRSPLCFDGTTT